MMLDVDKLKKWIQDNPLLGYLSIGVAVVLLSFLTLNKTDVKPKAKTTKNEVASKSNELGISVGSVDEKAYMARMEKNYADYEDRIKAMETQVQSMGQKTKELHDNQKELSAVILKLDSTITSKIDSHLAEIKGKTAEPPHEASDVELAIANISPFEDKAKDKSNSVYLPLGSFCEGTLLTGVYAVADQNGSLPVLISLDEAFYGPNKTRIPLKGAFVLGKAYGDIVSERALIQITAISSVLPNEITFEKEQNLGYVTDQDGELGIHGQVIYSTGRQLALGFMSGFMAGGSQAVADQQVTASRDSNNHVVREVTGDTTKHAIFSGLSRSAGKLSDYFNKQAENLIPAIHISHGQKVFFIVQKGVVVDGLSRLDLASSHYTD